MKTKICKACKQELNSERFHKSSVHADGYYPQCKECREKLGGKKYRHNAMEKKRKLVREAKNRPCIDCKRSFPTECMDFDHQSNKLFNIGQCLAKYGYWTIAKEITKCEIVCACCHRIRSAKIARDKIK